MIICIISIDIIFNWIIACNIVCICMLTIGTANRCTTRMYTSCILYVTGIIIYSNNGIVLKINFRVLLDNADRLFKINSRGCGLVYLTSFLSSIDTMLESPATFTFFISAYCTSINNTLLTFTFNIIQL